MPQERTLPRAHRPLEGRPARRRAAASSAASSATTTARAAARAPRRARSRSGAPLEYTPVRAGAAAQPRAARGLLARDAAAGARHRRRGGSRSTCRARASTSSRPSARPFKAYTIVIVSDLGLVTKTSPGQMLMFAANRFTGEPPSGCRRPVIADRAVVATGTTRRGRRLRGRHAGQSARGRSWPSRGAASQVTATDPGSWMFQQSTRDLSATSTPTSRSTARATPCNIKGVFGGGARTGWRRSTASRSR